MQFSQKHRRKAVINIISLVDVVFLLLIFFTVSATFMDQPSLDINLPKLNKDKESKIKSEPSIITITSDGLIYFGDKIINTDEIPDMIKNEMLNGRSSRVVINADTTAQYKKVFDVLQQLRETEVDSISFSAEYKQ